MKSPFPGMDPFIEGCGLWGDFHHGLIEDIKNTLARLVPKRYVVRADERNYVVLSNEEGQIKSSLFRPDVAVAGKSTEFEAHQAIALAEPSDDMEDVSMRAYMEEEFRESFVEIQEADGDRRLVTCIEVLSPSNKRLGSSGWDLYQRKRQGLLLGHAAHFVEIDLLRGGTRMPMLDAWPNSPYTLLVGRRGTMPYCRVRPAYFHKPVPSIRIPLLKPDADVELRLQPIIDAVYERSYYERSIDYTKPIKPPLSDEDAAWLQERLQERV